MKVSLLTFRSRMIYSSLAPPSRQTKWLQMGMAEVAHEADGREPRDPTLFLQANCYDEDRDEDIEVPSIAYRSYRQ